MYLFYVSNEAYSEAKSAVEELAAEGPRVDVRNPDYFSGVKELNNAEKVFVYGDHPHVVDACKEAEVEHEQLTEEQGSEEPSMEWNKDELVAYAESNDVEVVSRDTKQDIMDKINEASNG